MDISYCLTQFIHEQNYCCTHTCKWICLCVGVTAGVIPPCDKNVKCNLYMWICALYKRFYVHYIARKGFLIHCGVVLIGGCAHDSWHDGARKQSISYIPFFVAYIFRCSTQTQCNGGSIERLQFLVRSKQYDRRAGRSPRVGSLGI